MRLPRSPLPVPLSVPGRDGAERHRNLILGGRTPPSPSSWLRHGALSPPQKEAPPQPFMGGECVEKNAHTGRFAACLEYKTETSSLAHPGCQSRAGASYLHNFTHSSIHSFTSHIPASSCHGRIVSPNPEIHMFKS